MKRVSQKIKTLQEKVFIIRNHLIKKTFRLRILQRKAILNIMKNRRQVNLMSLELSNKMMMISQIKNKKRIRSTKILSLKKIKGKMSSSIKNSKKKPVKI